MRHAMLPVLLLGLAPASLAARDTPVAPAAPIGTACSAPVFRQFDFWLGRWTVTNPAGAVVGHSRVTRISRGCALHEHWLGLKSSGHSLNYYDAATRAWHQDWVGSGGQVLHLQGHREGTSMVLGDTRTGKQGTMLDRITWTPLDRHRVRQHWEISRDGGTTWTTVFDGTYAPDSAAG